MDIITKKPTNRWIIVVRAGLLIAAIYLYIQILGFHQANITHPVLGALYFIQLGIHEVAHIALMWLPDVWVAASGSLSEVVFTTLVVIAGWQVRSRWAVVFGLLWVMLAMMSMGNYMADAVAQAMPLVGPTPDPVHDWHFVFSELNWLGAAEGIGAGVKVLGGVIGASGLIVGLASILPAFKKKELVANEA